MQWLYYAKWSFKNRCRDEGSVGGMAIARPKVYPRAAPPGQPLLFWSSSRRMLFCFSRKIHMSGCNIEIHAYEQLCVIQKQVF